MVSLITFNYELIDDNLTVLLLCFGILSLFFGIKFIKINKKNNIIKKLKQIEEEKQRRIEEEKLKYIEDGKQRRLEKIVKNILK